MKASSRILYDPSKRLLLLTLKGLWSFADIDALTAEITPLYERISANASLPSEGRILIDLTEFAIQPPDVAARLAALLPRFTSLAGRIAILRSPSMLQNLQVTRVINDDRSLVVSDEAQATAWLFGH